MIKKIILFCGVESTGKTTTIEMLKKHFESTGVKVKVISEYGRDVCFESGGVYDMSLIDYEKILFKHQQNVIDCISSFNGIILLDTDSIYTGYFLQKDKKLFKLNKNASKALTQVAENIAKTNRYTERILKIIYLNSDCPFIQDGTRTYEKTRKQDDKYLENKYKQTYGKNLIKVISGENFENRYNETKKYIEKLSKEKII